MKLTKVKGHADDEMVRLEVVRAADKTMVMTVLMLLLSVVVDMFTSTFLTPVSSSFKPVIFGVLLRFICIVSSLLWLVLWSTPMIGVVVPLTLLSGLLAVHFQRPRRKRAVCNCAWSPGPGNLWAGGWQGWPVALVTLEDVSASPHGVGILVKNGFLFFFFNSL